MNILFVFWQPLGDLINSSCYIYDYHLQNPNDKLYIYADVNTLNHEVAQRINIFRDQTWISLWTTERLTFFDKIYELTSKGTYYDQIHSIRSVFYTGINQKYNLNIKQTINFIPLQIPKIYKQKINFNTNKQICLIDNSNFSNKDSRYWGNNKYQEIINSLYNDLFFIQIGFTPFGHNCNKLTNIDLDLINKTTIEQLMILIYNSRFIICREGGLRWLAMFKGRQNPLDIFTVHGNRNIEHIKTQNNQNIFTHDYCSNGEEYLNCCTNLNTKKCLMADFKQCKNIINVNNQQICKCMTDISSELIINDIKGILNK